MGMVDSSINGAMARGFAIVYFGVVLVGAGLVIYVLILTIRYLRLRIRQLQRQEASEPVD